MMRKVLIVSVLALCALGMSRRAEADDTFVAWQSPANGCVPVSDTEGQWQYLGGGGVEHATGVTGTLQFVCPLQTLNSTNPVDHLALTCQDSTTSSSSYAKAQLIRASRTTATTGVIATVTSDTNGTTTVKQVGTSFSHTFNFLDYYYFVVITIYRDQTSQTARAYQVTLQDLFN